MLSYQSPDSDPTTTRPDGRHITLVRPPAVSSRFSYTVGVVLPLGPAYVAGALAARGHRVAVVDAGGRALLAVGPLLYIVRGR